jgi:hypothetical protein
MYPPPPIGIGERGIYYCKQSIMEGTKAKKGNNPSKDHNPNSYFLLRVIVPLNPIR